MFFINYYFLFLSGTDIFTPKYCLLNVLSISILSNAHFYQLIRSILNYLRTNIPNIRTAISCRYFQNQNLSWILWILWSHTITKSKHEFHNFLITENALLCGCILFKIIFFDLDSFSIPLKKVITKPIYKGMKQFVLST